MACANRLEAGRHLAWILSSLSGRADTIVVAIPNAGVPVAFELASELHLPLDVASRHAELGLASPPQDLHNLSVILVDEGVATGATMRAAVRAARYQGARNVIVAVPLGDPAAIASLRHLADDVVCPMAPEPFDELGKWYLDDPPVGDDEVRALMKASADRLSALDV